MAPRAADYSEDSMADRRKNGHAPRANGAAIEVPDVHPATFNPRGRSRDGNGAKHGKANGAGVPGSGAKQSIQYNCAKCPGYCCSYPVIALTKYDIERLAKHFGLTPEVAEKRFTKSAHGHKRIFRRKADQHFGKVCRFFDQEKRCCGVYEARPAICRSFPGAGRCGYYDFLSFERRTQGDPEFVSCTDHG
jgi:Fe-S-cluster containining protein